MVSVNILKLKKANRYMRTFKSSNNLKVELIREFFSDLGLEKRKIFDKIKKPKLSNLICKKYSAFNKSYSSLKYKFLLESFFRILFKQFEDNFKSA